ncbi:aminoglycoside phosphotransferase family protein [Marinobacter sp. 2_MG-2023]|uniref:aminoglycoside phosphotransferase family protein n=1 Tax=Marinobacter sp. 2_MG-2023 TaxID=3062679 RepID=UPI0026E1EC55|nr:phosphotransferase [Marinobacter sp. 2_MG-2023]MDO6441394.1 phosphotransferase [Marinobacter sp. 2_MG-2023]
MDNRLQMLTSWVRQFPGFEDTDVLPVSGDASFRRYFRIFKTGADGGNTSFIAMDSPPEQEDCAPFISIGRHWHQAGIAVPQIFEADPARGLLLLEDFGDQLMLGQLNPDTANALYQSALEELVLIQQLPAPPDYSLPAYDTALLNREMALFRDWLLEGYLELKLDNIEKSMLDTTFALLRESALAQPKVTVHRDYHSRNLLVRQKSSRPGVIDFQDAVTGPVTYDAVSLLKDCYIQWPEERISAWLETFRVQALAAGLHHADSDTFRQWFELMGMQRHLKAAGIFARLAMRDGKSGYLADIPRTVGYLLTASKRLPALMHFHDWLKALAVPRIEALIGPIPNQEHLAQ